MTSGHSLWDAPQAAPTELLTSPAPAPPSSPPPERSAPPRSPGLSPNAGGRPGLGLPSAPGPPTAGPTGPAHGLPPLPGPHPCRSRPMASGSPSSPRPPGSQSNLLKPNSVHVTPQLVPAGWLLSVIQASGEMSPAARGGSQAAGYWRQRPSSSAGGGSCPSYPPSARRPRTRPPGPERRGRYGRVSRKPRRGRFPSPARLTHLCPAPPRVLARRRARLCALAPPPPPPPRSQQLAGKA